MESESSLRHLQAPAMCSYPESHQNPVHADPRSLL